jgi:hypothetical protein
MNIKALTSMRERERKKKTFLADIWRSLTVSIYISVYKNREQQHFELFFQEASHML